MSHTPRPTHTGQDPLGSANIASIDWNALMNRRATKRKYGERSSSCGSGRSSVDSFLSEDFGSGSRSPSPEDTPDPQGLAGSTRTNELVLPPHTSSRDGRLRINTFLLARWNSDWNAKWRYVPEESALPQPEGLTGNAPASAAQLSSSSSLSLAGGDSSSPSQKKVRQRGSKHPRKSLAKAVGGAIRRRVIKKKAKKWFTQLTAQLSDNGLESGHGWRQRRVAGEELLRITQEAGGEVVVARRFTKTLVRQETGLRAILRLCEEEGNEDSTFEYAKHHNSHRLLVLVMLHADRALFLERVISSVLREPIEYGAQAILFLATSIPDFFTRIDPAAISEYGMRVTRGSVGGTSPWLRGTELLYHLFCHKPTTQQGKSTMLSVGRFILDSTMELCSRDSIASQPNPILRVMLQTSWVAEEKGILASILPSPAVTRKFIDNSILELSRDSLGSTSRALQFRMVALLAAPLQIIANASPRQLEQLGSFCTKVMLRHKFWRDLSRKALGRDPRVTSNPQEGAFHILCTLPEPIFQRELRLFILPQSESDRPASLPSHAALEPVSDKLDLLLWLSNVRENTAEAHRALIGSDSCQFLRMIITSPVPPIWCWEDRGVWRHKGLAMTCFGNIMEKMDGSELRCHVPREIIETVVGIKEDEEAPLAQRDQAIFMLQRYTIAADRCGVEPYHREAATVTEDQKEREQKVKLGQVQVRD